MSAEQGWPVWTLVAVLVLTLAGVVWRWRRDARALAEARAARQSALDAQTRTAALAVAAERIRIVREMHDVLAHSLAIMIAQADGGSYAVADRDAARRAFLTIAETGRAALTDTRRVLGVLRHGEEEPALLTPTPDDAALQPLVERAREAGLVVSHVSVGQVRVLPAGSRMALFRICQESLTNVLKHAGREARVIVTENWRDDDVVLTVTNHGGTHARPTDDPLGGYGLGLIGMRERAELVGGRLVAEPTEDGFAVRATLPFTSPDEDAEGLRAEGDQA